MPWPKWKHQKSQGRLTAPCSAQHSSAPKFIHRQGVYRVQASSALPCGSAVSWDLEVAVCVHQKTLVVSCWPSQLIMMKVGSQASTCFLVQWVPWGERRGSWYSLIVWACCAGAQLSNNGLHWWSMALHIPKPTHIAVGRHGSRCWGIARWGFRIKNGRLLLHTARMNYGHTTEQPACTTSKADVQVWKDTPVLMLWHPGRCTYFQHLSQMRTI